MFSCASSFILSYFLCWYFNFFTVQMNSLSRSRRQKRLSTTQRTSAGVETGLHPVQSRPACQRLLPLPSANRVRPRSATKVERSRENRSFSAVAKNFVACGIVHRLPNTHHKPLLLAVEPGTMYMDWCKQYTVGSVDNIGLNIIITLFQNVHEIYSH